MFTAHSNHSSNCHLILGCLGFLGVMSCLLFPNPAHAQSAAGSPVEHADPNSEAPKLVAPTEAVSDSSEDPVNPPESQVNAPVPELSTETELPNDSANEAEQAPPVQTNELAPLAQPKVPTAISVPPEATLSAPGAPDSSTLVRGNTLPHPIGSGSSDSIKRDSPPVSGPKPPNSVHKRVLGAVMDVGFPDGLMAGIAGRPWSFARAQTAVGTNGISLGVRGGVALRMPTTISPSLAVEAGYYFEGNANAMASKVAGSGYQGSPIASAIGYQFVNLHAGVEFGNSAASFFLQGGISCIHARLHHVGDALGNSHDEVSGATVISFGSDPRVTAWMPSVKFGFLLYLV